MPENSEENKKYIGKTIDFHIHIFPDALAEKAMGRLSERAKKHPYTNGTLKDTLRVLEEWNTDYAVSLNIAVQPKSVQKVNDFAIESNGGRIISFGSVHPYSEIWESELERISASGLKGIKLHPEYQEFDADDTEAMKVYRKCGALGLAVLLHSGKDLAYPDTLKASPEALQKACALNPDTRFILAHMGGEWCWDGVIKHLAGRENVWFDTAYAARSMEKDVFLKVAEKQGIDKIFYATDCPWESGKITREYILDMGFTGNEISDIMYNNAYNFLGVKNG